MCISVCCTRVLKSPEQRKSVYLLSKQIYACNLLFALFFVIFLSHIETHRGFSYFYLYFDCTSLFFYTVCFATRAIKYDTQCVYVCVCYLAAKINIEYLTPKIPALKLSYRHMSPHSNIIKYISKFK